MKIQCAWRIPAKVGGGLLAAALCALPQAYTISARPGAVNYIEGKATFDGKPLPAKGSAQLFLAANDTLETADGKAEVLLTPGVYLRMGAGSAVRMVTPHLTNTVVELTQGEAFVEVAELQPDNNIQILDHGATVTLKKTGLYSFTAGDGARVQTFDGKALVAMNGSNFDLGKGHELELTDGTKVAKFDAKKTDDGDLYAWSKVRDEYDSASSYDVSSRINTTSSLLNSYNAGWAGPGWMWNSGWNSWAWLPGDGAFFSPFGFGYYSPYYVQYAPVVYVSGIGGATLPTRKPVSVPVNPAQPSPVGAISKPVVPSGAMSVRQASYALSGVRSTGGHIGGSAMVAQARASGASSSGGGRGFSGGSGGFSGNASSAGGFHGGGSPGGGGGGHK